jgi:aspartate aminotransferase-like enzyme
MAILLNPGPVSLSERVRKALLRPDICHREAEFSELQTAIRHKLPRVYSLDEKTWSAVLLTGSGTAAVEAMLTSLVPVDGRVLILANGVYGERMAKMAAVSRHRPYTAKAGLGRRHRSRCGWANHRRWRYLACRDGPSRNNHRPPQRS